MNDESKTSIGTQFDDSIWQALTSEPSTGVAIVTSDGWTLYINDQAAMIFIGDEGKAEDLIGTEWRDRMPEEWINERLELLQRMKGTDRPVLMRVVWHGHQHLSWITPIDDEDEAGVCRFLVITRRLPTAEVEQTLREGDYELIESDFLQLGPLAVLTSRELEVLALLGQGLTIKQIAAMLYRSPKTIDNHRQSIGRKLGEHRGVRLVELAQRAGLTVRDAERKRV